MTSLPDEHGNLPEDQDTEEETDLYADEPASLCGEDEDEEDDSSTSSENEEEKQNLRKLHEVAEEDAKKLVSMLVLAQNSDSEGERTAALAAANRFAIKKQIDLASIEMEGLGETKGQVGLSNEPFISQDHKTAKGDHRRPPCHKFIAWTLHRHFRVDILTSGSAWKASTITLIGRKSDVIFAIYAYDFLVETFNRMWRDYKRREFAESNERNSYFYGLYVRLHDTLEKSTAETIRQELSQFSEETKAQQKWDVAVVQEKDLLDQATKGFHPTVTYTKGLDIGPIVNRDVVRDGMEDGANIRIERPLDEKSAKGESASLK